MKLLSSVLLLGSMGMLFAGCGTNPTVAGTPQVLPLVTQANLTTTTQSTELATDTQKPSLKVGDISELKGDKTCDDVGETLVYAETKSYFVYVCGDKKSVTPAVFRAKNKNGQIIEGKAIVGWWKNSFVGINDKYGFSLGMPIPSLSSENLEAKLFFVSKVSGLSTYEKAEHIEEYVSRYLSIRKFMLAKRIGFLNGYVEGGKSGKEEYYKTARELLSYINDNKSQLNLCEVVLDDGTSVSIYSQDTAGSKFFRVDKGKYLVQLSCQRYKANAAFNYLLMDRTSQGFEVKIINKTDKTVKILESIYGPDPIENHDDAKQAPRYIPRRSPTRFLGLDSAYNAETRMLSIITHTGDCGGSSRRAEKFELVENELELRELRQGFKGEFCDSRAVVDSALLRQKYP
jgi:hypothetical protein